MLSGCRKKNEIVYGSNIVVVVVLLLFFLKANKNKKIESYCNCCFVLFLSFFLGCRSLSLDVVGFGNNNKYLF